MRVIELSNHPGDMLHDVSLRREATQRRAQARYDDALIQHRARVQTIRVRRDRARRNRQWRSWLRLVLAVWAESRRKPPKPAGPPPSDTDTQERIKAGIAGEQLVATQLGRALDDDWTLLRGYRNRRGEIDHLLLGPKGLFAIEVKNINATVAIDGDRWRADKYDNYGNLVEQYAIGDQSSRHRSPSVQLNEPADELERFLSARGEDVGVLRVVLLVHSKAEVGTCHKATVNIFTRASEVIRLVGKVKQPFDPGTRKRLEELIIRDHRHHVTRPGRRPGAGR